MANVLPQEERRELKQRQVIHLLLVGAVMCVGIALVLALAVLPVYVQTKIGTLSKSDEQMRQEALRAESEKAERDELISTKKRTSVLASIGKETEPIKALTLALGNKKEGITITSVSYNHKNKLGTLTLSGVVLNRQLLQEYIQALQTETIFTDVSVPIASLTRTEAGSFDIVISGTF